MTVSGRLLPACGVLLIVSLQWGCASSPPQPPRAARAEVPAVNPPRSDRGNPPFYDALGKRYYVLASSEGYRARGVASWYGRDFHGLATSSGETYNMHALTAAHKTLPIPTWVQVTNLENGKTVIVKVNDRGPFVDDRLIDLSYAAAVELDMVRTGTARVEVRALGAPADGPVLAAGARPNAEARPVAQVAAPVGPAARPTPPLAAALVPLPSTLASAGPSLAAPRLFVQVGAFADRDNALKLVGHLQASGFANAFVADESGGRRPLHRVRIGPVRDEREFDEVSDRLRTIGVADPRLVLVP